MYLATISMGLDCQAINSSLGVVTCSQAGGTYYLYTSWIDWLPGILAFLQACF